MRSYTGSPYWDRYSGDTEHRKAGYTRVLAKPGLAEQASEFNEIQAIARDYIERLGNSLYQDGAIISGCTIHINAAHTQATIEAGRIFLDGLVRETEETTLTLSGAGTERIVASLTTTIVTASQDNSLRDPAQGAENYGLEGADREKQVVSFTVVSGDSASVTGAVVYSLTDGELPNTEVITDTNTFVTNDALAERTYDENGSYKVSGIEISSALYEPETEANPSTKVKAEISDGKAYVAGYPVTKTAKSSVLLDQSTTTRLAQSESHYYSSAYDTYELSNGPVASVNNMTCLVSVVGEAHYMGSTKDSAVALNLTPVDKITRVYDKDSSGNVSRVYVEGRDYRLYNNTVDWSPVGDDTIEPANGSTFYVDYVYNKTMVQGTDFSITNAADTAYVKFLEDGDKPDENSRFYISYLYTLARRDLLLLQPDGSIKVMPGKPDKLAALITPYNGSEELLELGYVNVYPTDALTGKIIEGVGEVVNYNSIRFTQESLYTMLQRVENLEDRMIDLDMERDLTDSEDTSSLNGYFTDNFSNVNKSDLGYRSVTTEGTISYTACIDYDEEELTTSFEISSADLIVDASETNNYKVLGTVVSAPYEYELALQQKFATGSMLVNPYAAYGPLCQVELTPDEDNWVDQARTQVYNTVTNTAYSSSTVYNSTYVRYYNGRYVGGMARGAYVGSTSSTSTSYTGTTTTTRQTASVQSSVIEYMRQRVITVKGKAFAGSMKNIYCKFNEIPVDLIPKSGSSTQAGVDQTVDGKTVHTVNATELGSFDATFTVPAGVRCGTVNVTFTGTDDTSEEYTGTAEYSATGTLMTTTITNTTVVTRHYNVLTTRTNVLSADPLAQSFILSNEYDRVLTKVGLYFAKKSTVRPAVLQIRDMVNGYPGDTVYAEVPIMPEDVNVSDDASAVTEVVLNQPVYCKRGTFYCFVVLSDSNAYALYYAQMGQNLLGSDVDMMTVNPYGTGVMFSSSNASTWTAHQASDLKFELYRSRYTGNGEIIFDEARTSDVTGIFVDVAYEDTANDGLSWFYRYKDASGTYTDWLPVDTLVFRDLETITDTVQLKAEITTNYTTSPFIDAERVSLRSFIGQKEATYISTHITKDDFDEPYQALKIQYQIALPQGASHKVFYQDTEGGDWIELANSNTVSLETKKISGEFNQYTWNVSKVDALVKDPTKSGVNFFKLRVELATTLAYNRPRMRRLSAIFKFA